MSVEFEKFSDVVELVPHGADTYLGQSTTYPWGDRVYGGQVVAQALWAAQQTVDPDYRVHSLHSYFIRSGDGGEPIRYEVDRIRNGRSFHTRRVVARQSSGAILNLAASFHRPEEAPDVTCVAMPDVPAPEDCADDSWTPLFDRRVASAERARARVWMRVRGPVDGAGVPEAALAFASDDGPMEAVQRAHPVGRPWDDRAQLASLEYPYMSASLDHSVWFHRPIDGDEWLLHDLHAVGVMAARGLARGEVFTADGRHVATVAQEVVLRELR